VCSKLHTTSSLYFFFSEDKNSLHGAKDTISDSINQRESMFLGDIALVSVTTTRVEREETASRQRWSRDFR